MALIVLAMPTAVAAHGSGQVGAPSSMLEALLAWSIDVPLLLAIGLAAGVYVNLARSVDRGHPANRWPIGRTLAFAAALGSLALALLSPIDSYADDLLTVHMVQHLLLTVVAPPFLAVSGIGTLALRAADRRTRTTVLLPILHSRAVAAVTFPVVGWLAFVAVMWGSHFSELYNLALLDEGLHSIEHLLYLAAACLFWWPLFSPDPLRWRLHPAARIFAVVAQMPSMSFLANTIIGASAPLYPAYLGRPDAFGIDALTDQRIAGSLMWLTGDFAFLTLAAVLLVRWFRHEEGEERRVDAQLERARGLAERES